MQDNKPVAFASKALTDTESRYVNIERELLAVVYGSYLYGRSFTVQSDHKTLESIHLKHLTSNYHVCNECCCAYNRTISRSKTDQGLKWKSPTPYRGFRPMKQSQSQIWTSRSTKYAHNSTIKYCKRFAWQLAQTRSSKS